jgi:hypothetical protein
MLHCIFEAIVVDVAAHQLVSARPHAEFVHLFGLDRMEKKLTASTVAKKTEKPSPRIERLLLLILEARRVQQCSKRLDESD